MTGDLGLVLCCVGRAIFTAVFSVEYFSENPMPILLKIMSLNYILITYTIICPVIFFIK